jgi:hypothetical protein
MSGRRQRGARKGTLENWSAVWKREEATKEKEEGYRRQVKMKQGKTT